MQEGQNSNLSNVVSSFNRDEKEEEVRARAEKLGMPYFDLRKLELSPDVLSYVDKNEALKGIIPIEKKNKEIILGVADPAKPEVEQAAEYLAKFYKVQKALISWDAVKEALPLFEGLKKQILEPDNDYEIQAFESAVTFADLAGQINSAPLQDILKFIVTSSLNSNVSDIHLEPQKEGARLRFRIDGVLYIIGNLSGERYKYVLSQIEMASGMKLNVDEAQEGRFEIKLKDKNISVRVETMPTLYGDDISLRIFNTEANMLALSELGLYDYDKAILSKTLVRPQGMILVVGPTGAGKTSTIYSILNELNKPEVKVITLEDPIEYALPGITQSQVHEDESFNTRLKAVLREDPDIIMVGEIRDSETANVALHAALTGHVMVSTFHANNAATALDLLKEISTDDNLLASAINLIIGQRLVRRLCITCRQSYVPNPEETEFAKNIFESIPVEVRGARKFEFYESAGCTACSNLGFAGRIGIFEMLSLTVELQKVVSMEDITVNEIQDAAKKSGMITMEQDGILKACDGITSISEVMKVVKE
jgi:type II secretory ATPase GspE/PulE/Tfp pilus assembly ATPase PilB-like protein